MTNETMFINFDNFLGIKYIRKVESVYMNTNDFDSMKNNFENIYQENTKLKAEINRSNGKSEMYRDMADSFCNSNIKLKAEIEQLKEEVNVNKCWSDVVEKTLKKEIDKNLELKSELEQSIKLPYPINTPIYFAYSKQGVVKDRIRRWQVNKSGLLFNSKGSAFLPDAIGKSIFLSLEEAEQSLKAAQP